MFDKLKDLKKLKDLDSALAKEMIKKEKDGIKVIVNGRGDVESISLGAGMESQERVLKELLNGASTEAKMKMARRAAEITGFGI
ncbi:MAG: hypothetical protein WC468_00705 [Candidatus Paceibacterota bacterium]